MSVIYYTNLIHFMEDEYEGRRKKNPHYSLRAFARDLGISPSHLSRFMNGSKGLSESSARKILDKFSLTSLQKKFLLATVTDAPTPLREIESVTYQVVDDAKFALLRDWYHFAILALAELPEFRFDTAWIGRRLGINPELAAVALVRLMDAGILKKTAIGAEIKSGNFANPKNIPCEVTREFHSQVQTLAHDSIEGQPTQSRDTSSLFLSVSREQFAEAREFIREFREAFDRKFSMQLPRSKRDAVYALAIQYFQVSDVSASESSEETSHVQVR